MLSKFCAVSNWKEQEQPVCRQLQHHGLYAAESSCFTHSGIECDIPRKRPDCQSKRRRRRFLFRANLCRKGNISRSWLLCGCAPSLALPSGFVSQTAQRSSPLIFLSLLRWPTCRLKIEIPTTRAPFAIYYQSM
jgi:hypothetical protein